MTHWQSFYHDATAEELDRYMATAHIAASPYALIACVALHLATHKMASRHEARN